MSCREMCHCLSPGKKIFFIPVLTQAYVDTVGKYEGAIKEYIQNQLQEDIMSDQISLKEFTDPFTGEPVKQGK